MTVGAAARVEASCSSGKCYWHISIQHKLLCPAPNNYGPSPTLMLPTNVTEQLYVDGIHLLGWLSALLRERAA